MRVERKVKVKVDDKSVKETLKKVKRLRKLLKEAKSLADELASKDLQLHIKI